jgi:hypothetical protein
MLMLWMDARVCIWVPCTRKGVASFDFGWECITMGMMDEPGVDDFFVLLSVMVKAANSPTETEQHTSILGVCTK